MKTTTLKFNTFSQNKLEKSNKLLVCSNLRVLTATYGFNSDNLCIEASSRNLLPTSYSY